MASFALAEAEFRALRDLIHRRFGIDLGPDKKDLIVTRLQSVLRRRALPGFRAYLDFLEQSPGPDAMSELIDRISTNHTFFHREPAHFDHFRNEVLPELVGRARSTEEKDLRVWCAAASTGEEPYTLMMTILDVLGADYGRWKAGLLATDLSADVLARAERGLYSEENVSRLPKALRDAYFERVAGGGYQVCARVRREVVFRRLNLIQDRYPFKRPFHVIFCRNVMIYFDRPTQERLVNRFASLLAPGGHLFIGHAESLTGLKQPFEYVQPALYRLP